MDQFVLVDLDEAAAVAVAKSMPHVRDNIDRAFNHGFRDVRAEYHRQKKLNGDGCARADLLMFRGA